MRRKVMMQAGAITEGIVLPLMLEQKFLVACHQLPSIHTII